LLTGTVWFETTSPQVIAAVLTGKSLANITSQPIPNAANLNRSGFPAPDPRTSEDCLFLDVVVPTSVYQNRQSSNSSSSTGGNTFVPIPSVVSFRTKTSAAPVLVNIFGGGFVIGDKNSVGNPAGLLARSNDSIIYVTFNYRLGLYV
jgi:carboxylesterase type B